MIRAMAYNQRNVSCKDDASLYNFLAGGDCIFAGVGDMLACDRSGLTMTLKTGGCLIGGRHVYVEHPSGRKDTLTLPINTTGYVVLRYRTNQPAGSEVIFTTTTSLATENLNNGGSTRDLVIASFTTNGNSVTAYQDRRVIKPSPTESVFFELRGKSLYITKRN